MKLHNQKLKFSEHNHHEITYSWEGVASVRDQHARLANGSVADGNTFDESCSGHLSLLN